MIKRHYLLLGLAIWQHLSKREKVTATCNFSLYDYIAGDKAGLIYAYVYVDSEEEILPKLNK